MEEACGYTEECVAGLKLMVEASGGRHAFIKGYQTLLAAVDADNASQVSGLDAVVISCMHMYNIVIMCIYT